MGKENIPIPSIDCSSLISHLADFIGGNNPISNNSVAFEWSLSEVLLHLNQLISQVEGYSDTRKKQILDKSSIKSLGEAELDVIELALNDVSSLINLAKIFLTKIDECDRLGIILPDENSPIDKLLDKLSENSLRMETVYNFTDKFHNLSEVIRRFLVDGLKEKLH